MRELIDISYFELWKLRRTAAMAEQAMPTLVYAEKGTPFGLLGAAALLRVQYAAKPDASLGKDKEPELVFAGGCAEWAGPGLKAWGVFWGVCWRGGVSSGAGELRPAPSLLGAGPAVCGWGQAV